MRSFFLLCFSFFPVLHAQDQSRDIWDSGFRQKRPSSTSKSQAPPVRYRAGKAESSDPAHFTQAALGLTIWRLRPPVSADNSNARILVQDTAAAPSIEFTAERVETATNFHPGDRIRIAVEVPRSGFLYVIDRECYTDDTMGGPVLLFPTRNVNNGDNAVSPGRLVEIPPSHHTAIRALRLTKSGPSHVGEDLLFLIADKPLLEIVPAEGEQQLPISLVTRWDREWSQTGLELSLVGGEHNSLSAAERLASGDPENHPLSQSDPMPETIVSVAPHPAQPLIVHLHLSLR